MILSAAQIQTLKNDILADSTLAAQPLNSDGAFAIAAAYNLAASPAFTVWKSLVPLSQVGMALDFNAIAGLTTANATQLQTLFQVSPQGINAYLADRRAGFDNIFSGTGANATTRASLLALWKRFATRAEKLYATGTGSDAAPATLVVEGALTIENVQTARGG